MTRLWVVRAGREGEFEDTAIKTNKMALGWDKTGNLSKLDQAAIRGRLREAYPDQKKRTLSAWAGQLYRFINGIRVADIVIMPRKNKDYVLIGKVDGEYYFDPDSGSNFRHLRSVKWKKNQVRRDVFQKDMRWSLDASGTVFEVRSADAVNRVREILENGSDPGSRSDSNFDWIPFYEAVADRLRDFEDSRDELLKKIFVVKSLMDKDDVPFTNVDEDIDRNGDKVPLKDICPFTSIGTFTKRVTPANRQSVAHAFAEVLGISKPRPHFSYPDKTGIPLLHAGNSWFFGHEKDRRDDDIDKLWEVFRQAIIFAESDDKKTREAFVKAYDKALLVYKTSWARLTMGLFWIRPYDFLPLDKNSQEYVSETFKVSIPKDVSASEYLKIRDEIKARFKENDSPVHSFPELSLVAWEKKGPLPPNPPEPKPRPALYSAEDIIEEGCFFELSRINEILERLRDKKNIVLQGPPGTGKTWLAKKLAFALMEKRVEDNIRSVQFHPNLSYEDFVRGWRPSGDGKLKLVDGPFLEIANAAEESSDENYVIIIEEINRGNPAQIFGELLTLLEADKRAPNSSLALCYPRDESEKIFIPENLYVIGTMNIADRSLALVDFALRRRFAFMDLEPALNDHWLKWCREKCGISDSVLRKVKDRIESLNEQISDDQSLGPQFRIGHSYVTPNFRVKDPDIWFRQVVQTEIGPLLEEYWFDSTEKARDAAGKLLEGGLMP